MSLFNKIYLKFFIDSGFPYAAYLKKQGFLHDQGDDCFISKAANIPDPHLVSIGSNVWITSGCQLLCHDASVIMINKMRKAHFDRVAPIVMGDHCFLGNNSVILPGITLGSQTIVGAGSVVTKDVPDDSVVAGNPARLICSLHDYAERIETQTRQYPWYHLLQKDGPHVFDPELEKQLIVERVKFFFESKERLEETDAKDRHA